MWTDFSRFKEMEYTSTASGLAMMVDITSTAMSFDIVDVDVR